MRRLGAISTLTFIGALSAFLSGCPIWSGDGGGATIIDGGTDDVVIPSRDSGSTDAAVDSARDVVIPTDTPRDTGPTHCSTNADCGADQYCGPNGVCITTQTCSASMPCPNGEYCDARGACEPGCNANADCAYLSSELVCDTTTHQCVRGGGCTDNSQCASGEFCIDGSCRAGTDVCTFDYQCGSRTCVNGRCVDQCSTLADGGVQGCATGQICVGGYCQNPTSGTCNCAADEICTNGLCSKACTTDTECGAGNFCDNGVCRVDDRRPPPFCTPTSGCASGSVCVDGVCRLKCPTPNTGETADQACQRVAVNFTTCDMTSSPAICRDPNEQAPQCTPSTPCATGMNCIDGRCH